MPGVFGQGQTVQQGSKRDGAPQGGLPGYQPNLNAPANFWQGNNLQIPGAQGLGSGAISPTMQPPQPGKQHGGGIQDIIQQLMGSGLGAAFPGLGGLAGLLGGGGGGQMPGSGSSTLPTAPGGGMAQALAGAGGGQAQNPGIQRLLQMIQQQ